MSDIFILVNVTRCFMQPGPQLERWLAGCIFIYLCSAQQIYFKIKFKFINLKRICRAKHECYG